MNMKELNSKFLSLLRYVPYIVDEKPMVQWFLSCLSYHIKDIIEYDNPKTLEEAMRKVNFCYEHNRKKESMTNQKDKKNNNTRNFPSKNFHCRPIQIIKGIKNLLTTIVTIQRILNEKNP